MPAISLHPADQRAPAPASPSQAEQTPPESVSFVSLAPNKSPPADQPQADETPPASVNFVNLTPAFLPFTVMLNVIRDPASDGAKRRRPGRDPGSRFFFFWRSREAGRSGGQGHAGGMSQPRSRFAKQAVGIKSGVTQEFRDR